MNDRLWAHAARNYVFWDAPDALRQKLMEVWPLMVEIWKARWDHLDEPLNPGILADNLRMQSELGQKVKRAKQLWNEILEFPEAELHRGATCGAGSRGAGRSATTSLCTSGGLGRVWSPVSSTSSRCTLVPGHSEVFWIPPKAQIQLPGFSN